MDSMKLYSPLEFYLHDQREEERNGEYGVYDLYDDRYVISHEKAFDYMDSIELAIRRDRDRMDQKKGMAEYLSGTLAEKVESMFPNITLYNDALMCVTEVKLREPLTAEETTELKDWWSGQLSDGWGEGFEQRAIDVNRNEELYIVPWRPGNSFYIDTEREFMKRMGIDTPLSPAEKALDEPDASDSAEVAALRDKLFRRLDINFADYFDSLQGRESSMFLTDLSSQIAAIAGAYGYMTEIHNFHPSELNYLLQFQNPLRVVADEFEWESAVETRSDVMWSIFHKQDAINNGKYPLEPDEPKGYIISVTDDDRSFYIPNITHIERDDSLNIYLDDDTAAKAAEKDGIKLIYGIPFVPDGVYLDTPENRESIAGHFEQHRLSLPAEGALTHELISRIHGNYSDYKYGILLQKNTEIWDEASEIAAVPGIRLFHRRTRIHDGSGRVSIETAKPAGTFVRQVVCRYRHRRGQRRHKRCFQRSGTDA